MTGRSNLQLPISRSQDSYLRGGAIGYRIALYYPELVTQLFCVCTAYFPPSKEYTPLEDRIKSGQLPNFGYQLQFSNDKLENKIVSRKQIKQLLNAMYGGSSPEKERGFDVRHGLYLEKLPTLEHTKLVNKETLDYYADEYARHGMHGPRELVRTSTKKHRTETTTVNWYRNREQNFQDELQ
jgi:pimeloyl-ACP methyl ester carboxylesterase